jgi:hypothetical protein
MDPQFVQNLRYKLQKRVRRLNSINSTSMFVTNLRQFWLFFDNNPTYTGLGESLVAQFPAIETAIDRIFKGEGQVGTTEEESAALGYSILRRIAQTPPSSFLNIARLYGPASKSDEALETVRDVFLEPFYEYLDEQLDDQRATLTLLLRYKHRSEWFHRTRLWDLAHAEPRKAETSLALDLYCYLYDQGIDFNIESSSLTGEIDLIGAQDSEDPLLADTKIFDGDSRSKTYIRKAFNQIYTYTQQYNEPFGYLVIYKITDRDLHFSLATPSRNVPVVLYNHKTIFLITVDIFLHPKPVSQRDPLRAVTIAEGELIRPTEADVSE